MGTHHLVPLQLSRPQYHPMFLRHGWNFHLRAALQLKKHHKPKLLDSKLEIKAIDTLALFKTCFWYKERAAQYGSDEAFLAHGRGYALCLDNQVVGESYLTIGGGYAEIGIVSHPDFRGRGYASLIASYSIQECIKTNITPEWSCNANNQASLNTGLKLGFEINRYFTFLVRNCENVLCPNLAIWLKNNPYP